MVSPDFTDFRDVAQSGRAPEWGSGVVPLDRSGIVPTSITKGFLSGREPFRVYGINYTIPDPLILTFPQPMRDHSKE
jgi:hypothetical protein